MPPTDQEIILDVGTSLSVAVEAEAPLCLNRTRAKSGQRQNVVRHRQSNDIRLDPIATAKHRNVGRQVTAPEVVVAFPPKSDRPARATANVD